jgi:Leucine-rich repeat (LRR) protein
MRHMKKRKTTSPWGNDIEEITPLKELADVVVLNLNANKIIDITPLAPLKMRERLECYENRIRDISVIDALPRLKILNLPRKDIEGESEKDLVLSYMQAATWHLYHRPEYDQ